MTYTVEALPFGEDHFMQALSGLLLQTRKVLERDPGTAEWCIAHATARMQEFKAAARAPLPQPTTGGLAPWQVAKVKNHVEAHLTTNITSNDLCALVRLSPSHFSRAFKASFGCSPHAHVIARRIDRAKLMMLETSAPLCEVALACGFADQSHFSTKFRRAAGQAPRAWRRVNTT
jgi:AraC family transcriptional regulator